MVRHQRNDALAQALRAATQAIEQAIGGAHRRPGTSLLDRHFVLAFKIRSTSAIACGFWCALWSDGTMSSVLAPSVCELQYGTAPSLE